MGQALITRRGVPMLAPDVDDGYEQIINYTMLYDGGDECEEVTGGWTYNKCPDSVNTSSHTATKNANNLTITGSNAFGGFDTNNAFDIGEYLKFFVVGHVMSPSSSSETYMNLTNFPNTRSGDASGYVRYALIIIPNTNTSKSMLVTDVKGDVEAYAHFSGYKGQGAMYNMGLCKSDDYTSLCSKAGISAPSTLEALIADIISLSTIFNNEDAAKFMVAQCTGDFMVGVLNSADAVALLKESPYLNLVVANVHWAKFIMMIPTAKELLGFTMLYDHGNECTDVTGGWVSAKDPNPYSGWTANAPTLTKNTTNMVATQPGGQPRTGLIKTVNTIDFTNYSLALAHASASVPTLSQYIDVTFRIASGVAAGLVGSDAGVTSFDGIKTVDVSGVSSANSPYFSLMANSGSSTATKLTVNHVVLTKPDDYTTLCSKAGINVPSDIATLVADSTAMAKIMSNEQAVKYLMGCTGDLMVSILTSSVAVGAIVNSAYATEMLTSHPAWAKFIKMSPVCADAGLDLLV